MLHILAYTAFSLWGVHDSVTSSPIDTVIVKSMSQRSEFSLLGRSKLDLMPSTVPQTLQNSILFDGVFLKQYGVSGSATVSRRGADASQTQVIWNGLPINNLMLGLTDFNNVSSFGLQDVFIVEGANASLFGSGSVGGTVFLKNKPQFSLGERADIITQRGSFGQGALGLNTMLSTKSYYLQLTASGMSNANEFGFYDPIYEKQRTMKFANQNQQLYRMVVGKKFNASNWKLVVERNTGYRELGMMLGSEQCQGYQKDANFRSVFEFQTAIRSVNFTSRYGYVRDGIIYSQSGTNWDSSSSSTHFLQTELYKTLGNWRLLTGLDVQWQHAYSINYIGIQQNRTYPAVFLASVYQKGNTDFQANFRWESFEKVGVGNVTYVQHLHKWVSWNTTVNSSFRRPTLNDYFWNTQINSSPHYESGYGTESGFKLKLDEAKLQLQAEIVGFIRTLDNPLIWGPNGLVSRVTNYYQGNYQGVQLKLASQYKTQKWTYRLMHTTDWVKSAVKQFQNSPSYQQIFVPNIMSSIKVYAVHSWGYAAFEGVYNGFRFTQTDNQAWLPSYTLINFKVGKSIDLKRAYSIAVEMECRNALNETYQSMPGKPMPGRSFWVSLKFSKQHNIPNKYEKK